jgi:hypothetical protein
VTEHIYLVLVFSGKRIGDQRGGVSIH